MRSVRSTSAPGFRPFTRCLAARLRSLALPALVATPLLAPHAAGAGISLFTDPDVGGFVGDSATTAFLDAIDNDPTEFISFSTDRDGMATPEDGAVDGRSFSYLVELSSPEASGASLPENVLVTGGGTASAQAGPTPGFMGTLEISFQLPINVTAIGMGPLGFGLGDTLTVYDPDDVVLYSGAGASDNQFTFIGFTTDGGDLIGRVVLQGAMDDPFGIQDLQFVPEPGASTQWLTALAALLAGSAVRRSTERNTTDPVEPGSPGLAR
jgi:hypothetical protein